MLQNKLMSTTTKKDISAQMSMLDEKKIGSAK